MDDGDGKEQAKQAMTNSGASAAAESSSTDVTYHSANAALSDGTCVFLTLLVSLALLSLVVLVRSVVRRASSARAFDVASDASRRITDSFDIDDEASVGGWDGSGEECDGGDASSSVRSGKSRRKRRKRRRKKGVASSPENGGGDNAGFYAPPPDDRDLSADRSRCDGALEPGVGSMCEGALV